MLPLMAGLLPVGPSGGSLGLCLCLPYTLHLSTFHPLHAARFAVAVNTSQSVTGTCKMNERFTRLLKYGQDYEDDVVRA
jgi:hypothetical protein